MERKLELADIAMYLPYGLKVLYYGASEDDDTQWEVRGLHHNYGVETLTGNGSVWCLPIDKCKPILRPISDLAKSMTIDGWESTPMARICDKYPYARVEFMYGSIYLYRDMETKNHAHEIVLQWEDYDLLNRLHFDWRHDLIGQGLAIDINTLKD